ncbi:MAG: BrnA antitoxin family protein [Tateyamaria sp.]|uniref:BrnA antitoxin family protein n=1 Tax=Tateyamaria sp. TaxID=1929288 RepID=UPI00327D19D7
MPYTSRASHKTDMMYELERHQEDIMINWLDKSLPDAWTGLDYGDPVDHHKTRVTLRVDTEMLKWFRKLGPGYQARMNRVLRTYWTALLSGHIKGYPDDHTIPRIQAEAFRALEELKAGMNRDRGA